MKRTAALLLAATVSAAPPSVTHRVEGGLHDSPFHEIRFGAMYLPEPPSWARTATFDLAFQVWIEGYAENLNPAVGCEVQMESWTEFDVPALRLFGVRFDRPTLTAQLDPATGEPFDGEFVRGPATSYRVVTRLDDLEALRRKFALDWEYRNFDTGSSSCGSSVREVWARTTFTGTVRYE